jgi:hypothetical protein
LIELQIPYIPRWYFKPYHQRTQRFACIVAHRRCGKTVACINDLLRRATDTDDGSARYAYIAPTYSQAKTVAWDYLIAASAPLIPYGLKINQSELRVRYPNGAEISLRGADNYDSLRGMSLSGVVLDEYPLIDPRAWTQVIRPALSDRKGFATFIGTPRGHDSFYALYNEHLHDPEWFTASLKLSDLVAYNDKLDPDRIKTEGWVTSIEIEQIKKQISEDDYNQEYECDFEAAVKGAYYGKQMAMAEAAGRITQAPFDPAHRVFTAWDIGGDRDATACWFVQLIGSGVNVIDYYEATGSDSAPHARLVLGKPYDYAQHFLPHDAGPNRVGIDKSYRDFLSDHGLRNITVLPVAIREHGINLVRLLLPRCTFDAAHCTQGIEALKLYRADYDEKNKVLKSSPVHDWASHGADAFRYLAAGLDKHVTTPNFNRKLVYPKGF